MYYVYMYPIPKLERKKIFREEVIVEKTGVISIRLRRNSRKEYITCEVDLGAFYKEMRATLMQNLLFDEFKDKWGTEDGIKRGNFFEFSAPLSEYKDPKRNLTRPPGIFEKKFFLLTRPDSSMEFETRWESRCESKYSKYGWFEFALDIQARDVVVREVLVGNKKVKRHYGTWEFRNVFEYKNKIIPGLLHNIRYVRSNPKIQQLYIDFAYYKTLENDMVYFAEKIFPLIRGVILKYFRPKEEQSGIKNPIKTEISKM